MTEWSLLSERRLPERFPCSYFPAHAQSASRAISSRWSPVKGSVLLAHC